ncbi:DUF881 domain-containing protein [Georgenia sp. SYP-B2076]|uniref:DUF881 domain-containing protein n=1 Tax=Georgenia sp. SYP-B2076 TaxID=2495881 RepID=UPI0013DF774D|nr:DUF881 domain-containing protein [Georgenia sp. SYP-B2076]
MSLLREMLENPLDAGYTAVASGGRPPREGAGWRRAVVLLVCVAMGAGGVWAARELRVPQGKVTAARTLLVNQIDERRAQGDELRATNDAWAQEIASLQASALAGTDEEALARMRDLGVASGHVRVRGPGIVVELTDSRAAQDGAPGSEDERVQDLDLQVLVNGLWAAGAEAIAIDGQRLGATTAIRSAGQAVLVNLEPVSSPYEVEVIGDPTQLQSRLAGTPAATHLGVLRSNFDITVEVRSARDLELPADPAAGLRFATPVGDGGGGVAPKPSGMEGSGANMSAGPSRNGTGN